MRNGKRACVYEYRATSRVVGKPEVIQIRISPEGYGETPATTREFRAWYTGESPALACFD